MSDRTHPTRLRDGTHIIKTTDGLGRTYFVDSPIGTRVTLIRGAVALRREGRNAKNLTKVGQSYDVTGPPAWLDPVSPDNVVVTVLDLSSEDAA